MKILLLGNKSSHLALRLAQEARKVPNLTLVLANPRELKIEIRAGRTKASLKNNQNLLDFDVVYFYAIGKQVVELAELAKYLKSMGKVVVEESLAGGRLPLDKFDWRDQSILPTPDYKFFFEFTDQDYSAIKYPVIVKDVNSSQGKGVFKISSREELKKVLAKIGTKVIVQKYLAVKSDYRVLVVGDQVLGVMERFKAVDYVASNRKPQKIAAAKLPASVLRSCIKATKDKGLAIAGLDLVRYRGKYYVWEINVSPQCRIFEKYTGVNAPAKILQYLQSLVKPKARA